jgi:hypothetical protein
MRAPAIGVREYAPKENCLDGGGMAPLRSLRHPPRDLLILHETCVPGAHYLPTFPTCEQHTVRASPQPAHLGRVPRQLSELDRARPEPDVEERAIARECDACDRAVSGHLRERCDVAAVHAPRGARPSEPNCEHGLRGPRERVHVKLVQDTGSVEHALECAPDRACLLCRRASGGAECKRAAAVTVATVRAPVRSRSF